jgi:single-strand DNA-binding protein
MLQKITIIGNLGNDPEMRYTPSGHAVTNFSVAANRSYTKSDGTKEKETTWFKVATWGKRAEVCNQYLKKGSLVYIDGRVKASAFEGSEGPRASLEVTAEHVIFLSTNRDGEVVQEEVAETEAVLEF